MATDINPFGDVKKMIEQFKMPGVDMTAIVDSSRKDIEALVQANTAPYEAMQSLARKQTEIMTQAMQGMQEAVKTATTTVGDPAKTAEAARAAFEKTLSDMKELADMARQSQAEAMAHLTKRGNEHLQEIKTLMQPK
jgi:phasin family protein